MNVFGDGGSIDSGKFLEYVATQLASDVATLVKTRDELAKRQGALSAAEDANKLKAKAQAELAKAQEQAQGILDAAKVEFDKALAAKADQDERKVDLDKRERAFNQQYSAQSADMTQRLAELKTREQAVADMESLYSAQLADLQVERMALEARIRAFQDKVAALTA